MFILLLISFLFRYTDQVHLMEKTQEPFFDVTTDSVFTGQEGGSVFLSCTVYNLNNRSVSWIRESDGYILTVDRETFISDHRFFAVDSRTGLSDTWSLGINHVRMADQGKYQCQVSAKNKLQRITELVVIIPQVSIAGGPEMHVKSGSKVQIRCIISQTVEPPAYVTWYFNGKMLVDFTGKGSQISLAHSAARSVSRLYLKQVNQADRGNYTCQPLGLPKAHVTLHVIEPVEEQRLSVTSSAVPFSRQTQVQFLAPFFCREDLFLVLVLTFSIFKYY